MIPDDCLSSPLESYELGRGSPDASSAEAEESTHIEGSNHR